MMAEDYRDEETLRRLYHNEGLSLREMGDRLGVSNTAVREWMEKHDIPRETPSSEVEGDWQDEAVLRELYVEKGLDQAEIADELGCSRSTVSTWLGKFDLRTEQEPWEMATEARTVNYAHFRTAPDGYEKVHSKFNYKQDSAKVHRLLAVAEYGLEAISGMHIHHRNNIPWDNRPENLEVLSPEAHGRLHGREVASRQLKEEIDR